MTHRILDRVQETTTSTGTGALTLAGATTRMQSFVGAGFVNTDTAWVLIEHATAAEWEICLATYSAGAITRAAPLGSSTGAAVAFSAGTKTISLIAPASKSQIMDASGNVIMSGPIITNGVREAVGAPTIAAGTLNLDLAGQTNFKIANNANATTINILNMTALYGGSFSLLLAADGTLRTWTWPASVVWLNVAPVLTATLNKRDLINFVTYDGGTTWFGLAIAQGF